MPRKIELVDRQIKCPQCGAGCPNIRSGGWYRRDKWKIPKYYCVSCKKGFSSSVIKVKFLKPPDEVEIGYRVKVEMRIEAERSLGVKEISGVVRSNKTAAQLKIKKGKENIYLGVWDARSIEAGKYIIEITVVDANGYASIHNRTTKAVQHYDVLIWEIAAEYNLDPFLIKGMIWKESSFKPHAKSSANAIGLTQLTPVTLEELKKKEYGCLQITNPSDPRQNVQGGVCYLAALIKKFGDIRLALGAYNWGPRNVIRKAKKQEDKFPKGVREYISRVMELRNICEAEYLKNYEIK